MKEPAEGLPTGARGSGSDPRTSPHRWRRRSRWRALTTLVVLGAGVLLTACGGGGGASITLYNGQHPQLTQSLVAAFTRQTGIAVRVRTDDGIVLADELLQEGSASPADVYFTENSPELVMLTQHHLLATLPASVLSQIPPQFSSPSGNWVGVALRISALTYNPSLVPASKLPKSILDLAQPQWKGKVAIAPTDSDFVPLVGAVIATHGTDAARTWLEGLKANAAIYQDDESVAAAVDRGQAAVGVLNQYYWYRLRLEQGTSATHSRLYYFPNHDVGTIQNVSGAAVLASSQKKSDAERFVDFLVSPEGQRIISQSDDFEYPARPGIAPNAALPPLPSIDAAPVDVVSLGNDQPAATLLQETGLT